METPLSAMHEAAEKYPSILQYNVADGVMEIFADNQTLSTMNKCEKYFEEWYMNSIHPKGRMAWNLAFGIWFHKIMEPLYLSIKEEKNLSLDEILTYADEQWKVMGLDAYTYDKHFIEMDGKLGAFRMVNLYRTIFGDGNERLRVIATELPFGRAREVPILDERHTDDFAKRKYPVRYYLVGRPDVVVDNGRSIGPLDFKTSRGITGKEHSSYKPYDALCGYVYGIAYILGEEFTKVGKKCDTAFVTIVSKKDSPDPFKRIVRFPICYTPSELEEFRQRKIADFNRLYELLVLKETPRWNNQVCNYDYGSPCKYRELHNVAPEQRGGILQSNFVHLDRWNPLTRGRREE